MLLLTDLYASKMHLNHPHNIKSTANVPYNPAYHDINLKLLYLKL
jgi:hypothetical protein